MFALLRPPTKYTRYLQKTQKWYPLKSATWADGSYLLPPSSYIWVGEWNMEGNGMQSVNKTWKDRVLRRYIVGKRFVKDTF